MNFLYPGFLFSLAAVAIPIIIHLYNFRKLKRVFFSNVQFLKEVEQKSASRQKLKNILVLIARILTIVFLVLAFAEPYIPGNNTKGALDEQVVAVYIDNSFSMETVNRDGSLLDAAKRRAKEIVSAYGLNDKFVLITNDFEGRHQRVLSQEEFLSAVDEVSISAITRPLQDVIDRSRDLPLSGNVKSYLYLVSDFQRNMFSTQSLKTDSAAIVRLVRLKANPLANISVDSLWFTSPIHKPGETEQIVVQLRNNSAERSSNVPIKLLIDNQQKAIGSLTVEPREVSRDTLVLSGLTSGWKKGEVQISDYPVVFDDRFYFSFKVRDRVAVLAINEGPISQYLQAVYKADDFFKLDNVSSGGLNYSSFKDYQLIVLNNLNSISDGLISQLKTYVYDGGSLFIFPSLSGDLQSFQRLLQQLNTDYPEGVASEQSQVSSINVKHPVFNDVFERIPQNLNLPEAKKYFRYTNRSRTARQNILEFPGRRSFLSQYRTGKGYVYLSAVPLDETASNFVKHSIFVPIMYQSAFLGLQDSRMFYILGRDQYLETGKVSLSSNQTLRLKKDKFETIPDVQQTESSMRLFVADQVRTEGLYELYKEDRLLSVFAFNNNRLESDLSYADDSFIASKFGSKKVELFTPGGESIQSAIKTADTGTQLWKLCIILALFFIAAEILLIRFFKPSYSTNINE